MRSSHSCALPPHTHTAACYNRPTTRRHMCLGNMSARPAGHSVHLSIQYPSILGANKKHTSTALPWLTARRSLCRLATSRPAGFPPLNQHSLAQTSHSSNSTRSTSLTRSIRKMLGPFATASRFTLPLTRCRYCRTPPAHRCPRQRRQQQRQRVTEGTAVAP